jgi:hypothetical protein
MENDAGKLQGMNGPDRVADGQTFTASSGSESRGFQVIQSGTFTWAAKSPKNQTVAFTTITLDPPSFIGGPIGTLTVGGGGEAAVFPKGTSYTIP